eukprot:TRINITY_DN11627_c0_g1_i1.p1 TRINITY_DN11627_c0_g1~~TRINITY_DN11627_c0_g1_i1.p1  ORF type:complete len:218 (-),score=98.67 TRINITY_DN11627_c0_g1_i1:65-718(-)
MSEFQLRDAHLISGRMADVFGGLGSGQVKADKDDLKRMRDARPDFDQQQMERSGLFKEKEQFKKSDDEEVVQFKRPRLDNSDRGGGRGGRGGRGGGGKMPGFKKNPSGYTKYTLADVPELSDRSNSSAAFDFLRKLKEGKDEAEPEVPADLSQRVVFKKRVPKNKEEKDTDTVNKEEDHMNIEDSNDKKESTKKSSKTKNQNNQMTLSHLGDDEEDE